MFYAIDEDEQLISVTDAIRGKHYRCPVCMSRVTFKSGSIKTPHFSHYRMKNCIRYLYKGESLNHLRAKHDIYEKLRPLKEVSMEIYLQEIEQIPDILFKDIALEVQFSTISPELILERSVGYASIGYDVFWILDEKNFNGDNPTHFQISTMNRFRIITYHIDDSSFYVYHYRYFDGVRWYFRKERFEIEHIRDLNIIETDSMIQISDAVIKKLIHRARLKKDIRDITLSSLYHLQMNETDIPQLIKMCAPIERYILNSPIEWKLYLMQMLVDGEFIYEQFYEYIKVRKMHGIPSKQVIVKRLLETYYMLNYSQYTSELEISNHY